MPEKEPLEELELLSVRALALSLHAGSPDALLELTRRYAPYVTTIIRRLNDSWISESLLQQVVYETMRLVQRDLQHRRPEEVDEVPLEHRVRHAATSVALLVRRGHRIA